MSLTPILQFEMKMGMLENKVLRQPHILGYNEFGSNKSA